MNDYSTASNLLAALPRYPMREICKLLPTDRLADLDLIRAFRNAFFSVYVNYTGNAPDCLSLGGAPEPGTDGWAYQTCTEAVMPICSNAKDDFFEPNAFDLNDFGAGCKERYGVTTEPYKVRMEFGLNDLRAATKVVFSNGDRDPWR